VGKISGWGSSFFPKNEKGGSEKGREIRWSPEGGLGHHSSRSTGKGSFRVYRESGGGYENIERRGAQHASGIVGGGRGPEKKGRTGQ